MGVVVYRCECGGVQMWVCCTNEVCAKCPCCHTIAPLCIPMSLPPRHMVNHQHLPLAIPPGCQPCTKVLYPPQLDEQKGQAAILHSRHHHRQPHLGYGDYGDCAGWAACWGAGWALGWGGRAISWGGASCFITHGGGGGWWSGGWWSGGWWSGSFVACALWHVFAGGPSGYLQRA